MYESDLLLDPFGQSGSSGGLENFIKGMIEASTMMRAQKEKGLAVLQKRIKTDR
jgi:hypothetical protein